MVDLLSKIFIYKGSEVNNNFANYLIDNIYRKEGLVPLNSELKDVKKSYNSILKDGANNKICHK